MPVVDRATAASIARRWLDAWNAHDVAAVVEHFAPDVVAASPLIDTRRPGSDGRLHGRDAVLAYYAEGVDLAPELHFELVDVLCGVDRVTIVYRNQRHVMVAESLTLAPDGTVVAVDVSYGDAPA